MGSDALFEPGEINQVLSLIDPGKKRAEMVSWLFKLRLLLTINAYAGGAVISEYELAYRTGMSEDAAGAHLRDLLARRVLIERSDRAGSQARFLAFNPALAEWDVPWCKRGSAERAREFIRALPDQHDAGYNARVVPASMRPGRKRSSTRPHDAGRKSGLHPAPWPQVQGRPLSPAARNRVQRRRTPKEELSSSVDSSSSSSSTGQEESESMTLVDQAAFAALASELRHHTGMPTHRGRMERRVIALVNSGRPVDELVELARLGARAGYVDHIDKLLGFIELRSTLPVDQVAELVERELARPEPSADVDQAPASRHREFQPVDVEDVVDAEEAKARARAAREAVKNRAENPPEPEAAVS